MRTLILLLALTVPFAEVFAEEAEAPALESGRAAGTSLDEGEGEDASMQEYLKMEEVSRSFRAMADSFVVTAARGDAAAVIEMISPNLRAQAGEEAVAAVVNGQVLPFFSTYGAIGKSVTITETSDQFGSSGFAYYMWMEPKGGIADSEPGMGDGDVNIRESEGDEAGGGEATRVDPTLEPRPFVLYVLQEGERIIIGNVLVDYHVEGRHQ